MNPFQSEQACREGWDLFEVDGRIQLQRLDDPSGCDFLDYQEPKFATDTDAIIFVALQANSGSEYHRSALDRLGTRAPPAPAVPLNGRLWWIADNAQEANQWKANLEAKGATIIKLEPHREESTLVDVIFSVAREHARAVLGRDVHEDEWLVE